MRLLLVSTLMMGIGFVGASAQDTGRAEAAEKPAVSEKAGEPPPASKSGLFALQTRTLEGEPVDLGQYAGKVILVVNVASKCGFTPQYEGLEKLYQTYKDRGLVVMGFPSNEFGGQEPGTPQEIRTFCERKFKVSFPMFEKVKTKAGPGQSPVYAFLTKSGDEPGWNFGKFLVGRDGQVKGYWSALTGPDSGRLEKAIEAELNR